MGTCQDQYLFQPVGADPYNGDLTGDKSSTLGVNCGVSTGRNSVIAIDKESYSSGSGFDRAPGITVGGPCATLQAQGVPHAVCYTEPTPFCKSRRAKSPDDYTTWKEGKVANTLNTFDQGEVRTNELVVEPMLFENHGQEVRFRGPLEVAPTAQAGYGEGGGGERDRVIHLILLIDQRWREVKCKCHRGKSTHSLYNPRRRARCSLRT